MPRARGTPTKRQKRTAEDAVDWWENDREEDEDSTPYWIEVPQDSFPYRTHLEPTVRKRQKRTAEDAVDWWENDGEDDEDNIPYWIEVPQRSFSYDDDTISDISDDEDPLYEIQYELLQLLRDIKEDLDKFIEEKKKMHEMTFNEKKLNQINTLLGRMPDGPDKDALLQQKFLMDCFLTLLNSPIH